MTIFRAYRLNIGLFIKHCYDLQIYQALIFSTVFDNVFFWVVMINNNSKQKKRLQNLKVCLCPVRTNSPPSILKTYVPERLMKFQFPNLQQVNISHVLMG